MSGGCWRWSWPKICTFTVCQSGEKRRLVREDEERDDETEMENVYDDHDCNHPPKKQKLGKGRRKEETEEINPFKYWPRLF